MVNNLKSNSLKPSHADIKIMKDVQENFGIDASSALLHLPNKESRKRVFRLARSETQPDFIEPTAIPKALIVS